MMITMKILTVTRIIHMTSVNKAADEHAHCFYNLSCWMHNLLHAQMSNTEGIQSGPG